MGNDSLIWGTEDPLGHHQSANIFSNGDPPPSNGSIAKKRSNDTVTLENLQHILWFTKIYKDSFWRNRFYIKSFIPPSATPLSTQTAGHMTELVLQQRQQRAACQGFGMLAGISS